MCYLLNENWRTKTSKGEELVCMPVKDSDDEEPAVVPVVRDDSVNIVANVYVRTVSHVHTSHGDRAARG